MKVFVFGGSGDVGEHVLRQLAAKGHEAITIVETENQAEQLRMLGPIKVMISKDTSLIKAIAGCEAIIYLAGSSLAAGEDQDVLVDHGAIKNILEEAQRQQIERLVYLSPILSAESETSKATGGKSEPEEWIKKSTIIYTVIHSTKTVSKPGKGLIEASDRLDASNTEIPYEDVATVLVEALDNRKTFNKLFEVSTGDIPVNEALRSL